ALEGLFRVQNSLHFGSTLVQGLLVDRAHELLYERRNRWIDAADVIHALLTPHLHTGLDGMPGDRSGLLSGLLDSGRNGDAAYHGHRLFPPVCFIIPCVDPVVTQWCRGSLWRRCRGVVQVPRRLATYVLCKQAKGSGN